MSGGYSRFKIQIYLTIIQTKIQMRNNTKFVNGKDQMKSKLMLVWMAHYNIISRMFDWDMHLMVILPEDMTIR